MIGYFNTYLQKYTHSQKQKTYTSLGLSLLLILLFVVLALRPTLLTVIELREKLHQGREAAQKLDQKIRNLEQAQVNFENAKPGLGLLYQALPSKPQVLDFMNKTSILAKNNNLLLLRIESGKTLLGHQQNQNTSQPADEKVSPIDFSLEAKGRYSDLKNFILDLENLLRWVSFKEVTLNKEKDSNDLSLTLSGQIYFLESNSQGLTNSNQP